MIPEEQSGLKNIVVLFWHRLIDGSSTIRRRAIFCGPVDDKLVDSIA